MAENQQLRADLETARRQVAELVIRAEAAEEVAEERRHRAKDAERQLAAEKQKREEAEQWNEHMERIHRPCCGIAERLEAAEFRAVDLEQRLERAMAVLKQVEWSGRPPDEGCPFCGWDSPTHKESCRLKEALDAAEGKGTDDNAAVTEAEK